MIHSPIPEKLVASCNAILKEKYSSKQDVCVVAGHYSVADCLSEVSHHGEAEERSFELGVSIANKFNKLTSNTDLVLLINDIGLEPEQRKAFKEVYKIPDNYKNILNSYSYSLEDVHIYFESAIRNKASKLLREFYKKKPEFFKRVPSADEELVRCAERSCDVGQSKEVFSYVIEGPNAEKLVVKEGPNPKCNLILATFFQQLSRKSNPSKIINIFNEIYEQRISYGSFVNQALFETPVEFLNLFTDGESIFSS